MGGADASGEGEEQCLLPESKPTQPGGGVVDEAGMTPAQKAQEKVTRAFREQVRLACCGLVLLCGTVCGMSKLKACLSCRCIRENIPK